MDSIRYSYCPVFSNGWAIGIDLKVDVKADSELPVINGGQILCKDLANDVYLRAQELPALLKFSKADRSLKEMHLEKVLECASRISISPAPHPFCTADGALSALHIEAGDTTFMLEWNSYYPEAWKGLEEFHQLMETLYKQHPLARRAEESADGKNSDS